LKPAKFEYHAPTTVDEAIALLVRYDGDAKLLAGGQSLVPAMNLRMARPAVLIDLNRVGGLDGIRSDDGEWWIGAMTRHSTIEDSPELAAAVPVLPAVVAQIGYRPIRNRGTVGGSLAHADPAADYPATIIALNAELVVEGAKGKRSIKVDDFFKGLMTTAVGADEILTEVRVPALAANQSAAYMKFPHPASRFAVVGVAAVLTADGGKVSKASIGITGAGTRAVRARGVETAITGKALDAASIEAAADKAPDGVDVQADLQGSVDYKKHLLKVFAKRAIEAAAKK
jgi:aerobic carbon-monoxide dehydrogenase medium subunit